MHALWNFPLLSIGRIHFEIKGCQGRWVVVLTVYKFYKYIL